MLINIRFGRIEERTSLEDLQRRASLLNEQYRAALLAHPDAIRLPLEKFSGNRVRVAETVKGVAGFAVVLWKADQTFELDGLFVDPPNWRQGIGRALVTDALERTRLEGGRALDVVANPSAEEFYCILGFEVIGEAETRFGPANVMRNAIITQNQR